MRPCCRETETLLEKTMPVTETQGFFLYIGVCFLCSLPFCIAGKGRLIGTPTALVAACSPMGPIFVLCCLRMALDWFLIKIRWKKAPVPSIYRVRPEFPPDRPCQRDDARI